MPVNKKGISANLRSRAQGFIAKNDSIRVGRVTDIILNSDYPNIEDYGGINGIGTIFFESDEIISSARNIAKPFFPQITSYPLVNELVLILSLPSTNIGENVSNKTNYYINMISLWNHPHHNAYPNPITTSTLPTSQQKDYQQASAGSIRRVEDGSTEINFNSKINPTQNTFIERSNIHPLLPFVGDNIYQGRWGNSIRLGSTAKPPTSEAQNSWSSVGDNGDPILIIRNGQPNNASPQGWIPITENINKDLSSIYLSSTQKLPILNANENYFSYNEAPEIPNQYIGAQVVINSDRLIFNAKKDHILLSGEKSINLSSNSSLNFDTNNFIIDAKEIKLGSKDASEPVILGDTFLQNLEHLVTGIEYLCQTLQASTIWPAGAAAPNAPEATAAGELLNRAVQFKAKISKYKSKKVKTL